MTLGQRVMPYRADWRDASQYPEFGSKDYERITWEFIRRSNDYADLMSVFSRLTDSEYENGLKPSSDTVLDGLQCVPKAKPGETARDYFERTKKRKRGGRVLSPKWLLKSRWYMEPAKVLLPNAEFDAYSMNFVPHVVAMRSPKSEGVGAFSLPLWPDEIAFRFRLDVSLEKQWPDALERFNSARQDAKKTYSKEVNLECAHFWLRAFDAHYALAKKGTGKWQDEVRKHLEQNPDSQLKQPIIIKDHTVAEWQKTALSYIKHGKFAALLYKREKTPADPTRLLNRMIRSANSVSPKKGRTTER